MHPIHAKLASIKILFRRDESLTLYGIPYNMRPGQQPGDLWRAWRDYVPPQPGHYGSKNIDLSDWIYLGEPGWFDITDREEIDAIKAWLAIHVNDVPDGPFEWTTINAP
jgi:hypothetical protein